MRNKSYKEENTNPSPAFPPAKPKDAYSSAFPPIILRKIDEK